MITLRSQKIAILPIIILIVSIGIANYFGAMVTGTASFLIFISLLALLFIINPLHAFIFSFIQNLNLFSTAAYPGYQIITIICMYLVIIFRYKHFINILQDKKLKHVFLAAAAFSLYGLINIFLTASLSKENLLPNLGYIFGFWSILPTYYFAIHKRKELFTTLTILVSLLILTYYANILFDLGIINTFEGEREGTGSTRLMGYDIRQFAIIFFYLIPAFFISRNFSKTLKVALISIGILAYFVLVLALYRLAMFYVGMGMLLSLYYISKYTNTKRIINILVFSLCTIIILIFAFSSFFSDILDMFLWTFDFFSGKASDTSSEVRFDHQLPILYNYISSNIFIGAGIVELVKQMNEGYEMYGYVDFPILGTLAAFGVGGMLIYYSRFYSLLSKTKIKITNKNVLMIAQNKSLLYIYLTLKAYFITMITFRLFYISWELTYDYQQTEFGLFAGVFLALKYLLKD